MRKNVLIIGFILLVVGIVIAGVSTIEVTHLATGTISGANSVMYPGPNGDFYSGVLNVSSGDNVFVVSSVHSYLIPSQDLSQVNSVNIGSYAVTPTTSSGNTSIYSGLNGTYYAIAFGVSAPTITYAVATGGLGYLIVTGLLVIVGVIVAIAGIIIAIIGAVLRPRNGFVRQF